MAKSVEVVGDTKVVSFGPGDGYTMCLVCGWVAGFADPDSWDRHGSDVDHRCTVKRV